MKFFSNHFLKLLIGLSIILSLWLLIIYLCNPFTGGFFLVDEQYVYFYHQKNIQLGFWKPLLSELLFDLKYRFRPLWVVFMYIQAYLLGANFYLWDIYIFSIGIITSLALFLFWFIYSKNLIHSLLFTFIVAFGYQNSIYTELIPAEIQGELFLILGLLCLEIYLNSKAIKFFKLVSILFFIISSFCKESFLLILPCLFVYYWIRIYSFSLTKVNVKNEFVTIFLLITALIFFGIIYLKFIGIKMPHPGVYTNSNIIFHLRKAVKGMFEFAYFQVFIAFLFTYLLLKYYLNKETLKTAILKLFLNPIFCLGLCIILIQHILYAQLGLTDRYIVPLVLGYGMTIISLMNEIFQMVKYSFAYYLSLITLTIFAYYNFRYSTNRNDVNLANKNDNKSMIEAANTNGKKLLISNINLVQQTAYPFFMYMYCFNKSDNTYFKFFDNQYSISKFDTTQLPLKNLDDQKIYLKINDTTKFTSDYMQIIIFGSANDKIKYIEKLKIDSTQYEIDQNLYSNIHLLTKK